MKMTAPVAKIGDILLHPATVIAAMAIGFVALYVVEGQLTHMPFVAMVVLSIATILFLVSARLAFSAYTAMTVVCITALISVVKYRAKGFDLHVYDIVFTGRDGDALSFLLAEFGTLIYPVIVVLAVLTLALAMIFRIERPRNLRLLLRSTSPICCVVLLPAFYPVAKDEPRYFYYLSGFNASAFYISLLDLPFMTGEPPIRVELDRLPDVASFPAAAECSADEARPDIFVVLSESSTDLSIFPQLRTNNWVQETFSNSERKRYPLRVETYAGGTWVSNLSLMTGLSSIDFGWQAPYLTLALTDRVHESLATVLANCGYRTVVQMPMGYHFVNEGPFLKSIGFETILDHDAIGATEYAHKDSFYFDAAETFIREHRKSDGRPLFMEIQSMFAHSPYDERAHPVMAEPAGEWTGDADTDEYIKRILVAQKDVTSFLESRAAESGTHPSLVLEFGDHQSSATRPLSDEIANGGGISDLASPAFLTYYTLNGYGIDAAIKADTTKPLAISYLGVSLLEAAKIPLSPAYADLAALRDRCKGEVQLCADRLSLARHMKRRLASGLLQLPE